MPVRNPWIKELWDIRRQQSDARSKGVGGAGISTTGLILERRYPRGYEVWPAVLGTRVCTFTHWDGFPFEPEAVIRECLIVKWGMETISSGKGTGARKKRAGGREILKFT